MGELKTVMNDHMDQMTDLVEKFTQEVRSGLQPAFDNFIGFFRAIDWKEPLLTCLMLFHVVLLLVTFLSRKNINFQMCLFLLALYWVTTGKALRVRIILTLMESFSQCFGLGLFWLLRS